MSKYDIWDPDRIFNLDKSGFSMRGMMLGSTKRVFKWSERGNTREIQFRGTCDHVKLLQVISAAGQIMTPIVVLPGVEALHKRSIVKYEKLSDFPPRPNY